MHDDQSLENRLSLSFVWTASVLIGIAGLAGYAGIDAMRHARPGGVRIALQSVLLWLAFGTALILPAALVMLPATWPFRRAFSRARFVAFLAALVLQSVALLSFEPFAALAVIPLAWLLAFGVSRLPDVGHLDRLACVVLALIVTVLASVAGQTALDLRLSIATLLGAVLVGGAIWLAYRGARRRPRRALGALVAVTSVCVLYAVGAQSVQRLGARSEASSRRNGLPNVVLIVLDTTRRDHIGAYGDTRGLTPVLDELARESTLYADAISAADWTVPSHASLFTGLYPATHGTSFAHHRWLDDRFTTLAEMLKDEGYQTLGLAANRYIKGSNLHQGFEHYVSLWDEKGGSLNHIAQLLGVPQAWADKGGVRATEALQQWLRDDYDPNRPAFVFVNFLEPHWGYFPPMRQRAKHLPAPLTYWGATRASDGFYPPSWLAGQAHGAESVRAVRAMYAGEVAYLDEQLGALLTALRAAFDFDQTVLIITADHGENLGEGGRWDHVFAVNDHLVHVPLLIRYPPRFPAGKRLAGQCATIDLVPTVYDVLGRTVPVPDLPGRSLVPEHFQERAETFSESVPYYDHAERLSVVAGMRRDIAEFMRTLRAIRTDRYKYVWSSSGDDMLFDLRQDPDEATNILDQQPDVGRQLRARLLAWWHALPRYEPASDASGQKVQEPAAPISPAERERLRMLGYMQ